MTFKACAAVVSANVPRFGGLFPLLALRSGFFLRLQKGPSVDWGELPNNGMKPNMIPLP